MKEKIVNLGKGIRKIVDYQLQALGNYLSSAANRLIVGLVMTGLGLGLIASAYIRLV